MAILHLAWHSLLSRRLIVLLTVLSIGGSVALLVGVERLRTEARASFSNTLSGTDLIVGARGGAIPLLLYSVFRIGDPTNNLRWESYQAIAALPQVAWTVPLSLGDSHRGYRVLGTTQGYFDHYRYAGDQALRLAAGAPFADLFDVVLGAEVADRLGYRLGDELVLAHGTAEVSFSRHEATPFRVSGILARTGTPVDRTLHVSLAGMEAIHVGWRQGVPGRAPTPSADELRDLDLIPQAITAALVGLNSRITTFHVQRYINRYPKEPLTAILPGVALGQLWGLVGMAEQALLLVSAFVVVVGLFGMLTVLLTGLEARRRELAILRAVGARPGHVFGLIIGESAVLTLLGMALGMMLLYALLGIGQPVIEGRYGLAIGIGAPTLTEWGLLGAVFVAGLLGGVLPGYRAYRLSLAEGLSPRA